jgi:uncharacterized protein involved in exopolysaccharide biosynthesis
VAFLLPPKYNVEAIVSLLPNKPFDVDLEQLDKGRGRTLSASEQPVEAAIALLVSENLIKTAIETVGASNMYPAPGNDIDKAYRSADRALTAKRQGLSNVIRIEFRHRDPNLAVSFTNALLSSFTTR